MTCAGPHATPSEHPLSTAAGADAHRSHSSNAQHDCNDGRQLPDRQLPATTAVSDTERPQDTAAMGAAVTQNLVGADLPSTQLVPAEHTKDAAETAAACNNQLSAPSMALEQPEQHINPADVCLAAEHMLPDTQILICPTEDDVLDSDARGWMARYDEEAEGNDHVQVAMLYWMNRISVHGIKVSLKSAFNHAGVTLQRHPHGHRSSRSHRRAEGVREGPLQAAGRSGSGRGSDRVRSWSRSVETVRSE